LLKSEKNQNFSSGWEFAISFHLKENDPPSYQLSLKLLEIRASNGSADSILTRAA